VANTIEELVQQGQIATAKGHDAYYLVGSLLDASLKIGLRAKRNVAGVRSLRADLDVGEGKTYKTKDEIFQVVTAAVASKLIPAPAVVDSGGGYHLYWPLIETLNQAAWEALSYRLLNYLRNSCGIAVDDIACTTDIARILRTPGTQNFKLTEPRAVTALQEGAPALNASRWAGVFDQSGTPAAPAGKQRKPSPTQIMKSKLARDVEAAFDIPIDPNMVFAECAQMRFCRDNPATISEPLWYSALGVAAFVSDETILAVSEGHPDYSPDEALRKAHQWKSSATGPTTCAKFFQINAIGCAGCAHAATVTTPVQLGKGLPRIIPIEQARIPIVPTPAEGLTLPSEQTLTPDVVRASAHALLLQRGIDIAMKLKLRIAQDGVFGVRTDPSTQEQTPIRLWGPSPIVVLAAQQIEGQYNLAVAYDVDMVKGTYQLKIVRMGALVGAAAPKEWAENFLVGAHSLAADYLINWAQLVSRAPACDLVGRHGFTDDTNTRFVVGDTVYTKDGESVALVRGDTIGGGRMPEYRRGDPSAWIKAAQAYACLGAEAFACTVLAAFASPLIKLVHEHTPAAIFLEGTTGRGKTTAIRVAASVWGNYKEAEQGGSSSLAGLRLHASKLNALPLFVDETRSNDSRVARTFLYDMSNGSGRVTGTPGQSMITRDAFTLMTVVTSNSPAGVYFFDPDKPVNRNTDEGVSARVIPLRIDNDTARAADEFMPFLSNLSLSRNHGLAGAQFIRYVMANDLAIERIFREAHQYVRMTFAAGGVAGAGERAAVTIAAIYAAGMTTNLLGLTNYDAHHLRAYMMREFMAWITERNIEYTASTDIADKFFEEHHRTVNVITTGGLMSRIATLSPMVLYKNCMYFAAATFDRTAAAWGMTRHEIGKQMVKQGFALVTPPFSQSIQYYQGPEGLYVAQVPNEIHS